MRVSIPLPEATQVKLMKKFSSAELTSVEAGLWIEPIHPAAEFFGDQRNPPPSYAVAPWLPFDLLYLLWENPVLPLLVLEDPKLVVLSQEAHKSWKERHGQQ